LFKQLVKINYWTDIIWNWWEKNSADEKKWSKFQAKCWLYL